MAHHTRESQQQPQTKSAVVVAEDKAERKKDHLRVLISNATSPMAHTIATAVAQGYVFGYEQPIILHLLDGKGTMGMLEGLVLELLDCTYPLLRQSQQQPQTKSAVMVAEDKADFCADSVALDQRSDDHRRRLGLHGHRRRLLAVRSPKTRPSDLGSSFSHRYGAALEKYAKKTVKAAPSIDNRNITALTRLEQNQALAQIASKLAVAPNKVRNVVVWGGKGRVPDAYNAVFLHRENLLPVTETLKDDNYLSGEFIEVVNKRARDMLNARSKYPSLSKGKAACDHMRDWWQGTAEGTWVSMGVVSNGAYGVPKGIVYSFPVRIENREWQIVEGIDVNPHIKKRIDESAQRTMNETQAAVRAS
ncbi:hypothetical protein HPB52_008212 [Rhipicephalus sanguineus]|uniref:Lactate/malate dehydrogenase C-terminal domain-containing protein n=1 Tax=Rhipicephalus sanguineus TaxID=34632 RepID=A0A9D4SVU9_RHISA|nr:hypothetical protein HPB52_008212 [Rhipicephalus sanguineus]